jgi:two-component system chemotaxis response regulator CheB
VKPSAAKVRVLIVDDSAIARDLLERGLSADPGIEVVGKAADAFAARDKIVFLNPDVITLDVEMPRMDGIEFLRRLLPQYPLPVVVVSAVTAEGSRRALDALEAGAVEVVAKPAASDLNGLKEMIAALRQAIMDASRADIVKLRRAPAAAPAPRRIIKSVGYGAGRMPIVALGASTGGTTALHRVLPDLPADLPPMVVVQHMPPGFTRMFAESLDRQSKLAVREAVDGMALEIGLVLIGPGDRHIRIVRDDGGYRVRLGDGAKVCGHRPSADVLFRSVAEAAGDRAVGVLMTGMGRDGADGLLAMRRSGARCLAQDEASSVVFGMPKEAWENGAAERLVPLDALAGDLVACLGRLGKGANG